MDDLERYFEHNPGRMIHKWLHCSADTLALGLDRYPRALRSP